MYSFTVISPTEFKVCLVPVGDSAEIECNGKCGGSYLWEGHDFAIILPPGCADETVTITLRAYVPCSTLKHGIVSAVFGISTNNKNFKKPITVRFPHCVNINSKNDEENLKFYILHKDSYEFRNGHFEIGKTYGSIELTNFCELSIREVGNTIYSYTILPLKNYITSLISASGLSRSQSSTITLSNMEVGHSNMISNKAESINRNYLELLILPKSHNEVTNWNGTYCIVQDIDTYMQVYLSHCIVGSIL